MHTNESTITDSDAERAYDTLAQIYDAFIPDPDGFIDFYSEFTGDPANSVLYIGCGTGRLLAQLATLGNECIGIDPSSESIDRATERLQHLTNATVLVDRMPEVATQARQFDRILIAGGAFEYLLTSRDQLRALERVKSLLRPRGRVALDVAAPPFATSDPQGNYRGTSSVPVSDRTFDLTSSEVRFGYDHFRQLVRSTCTFSFSGHGSPLVVEYLTRYTSLAEWRLLLAYAGFEATIYGDFRCGPVSRESSNFVIVGECAT
ncbi:class I SAM-dependent methyltransferase [Microbacterium sp. 2RAF4]|uniref:class I SAM-dependent methyltransferase n=1 Tax=Microbacterium sp. 2RAF4 TaxID=3232999 RepID=UPI003F9687B6